MINFNQAYIAKNQEKYIRESLYSRHISGDGPFTKKCSQFFEKYFNVRKALLTNSGTHALEMTAILLNLGEGDEVIVPSFTFVSTPNAFILRGAKPVFIDIRPDTLNLDENKIEELITDNTKAIYVVHYAGVGCEMDKIQEIADKYSLYIVEDNAHGLFGTYRGRLLGTFGTFSAQSFHETKNLSCGEGGALLINDDNFIERAEIIREKGTDRSKFFRGQIDKYSWVDIGSSYLPSDILAAILFSQIEEADFIQGRRKEIWENYDLSLKSWAAENGVIQPFIPTYCEQSYHMYYLLLPTLKIRQAFISYLKENGIRAVFHYVPLHSSKMGRKFGYREGSFPITEKISDQLVRLPMYVDLSIEEQNKIIQTIKEFQFP
ncbi:MAG: dTDP-4-amino-4,6-dideoxygalactose transaminase [Anaerolineaceae bacterium]|nr:dTDP-4-amino-4,6-dideoxygalactose transaminase [Anaerolineaceae bacterium]